jgi:hypothetical protein
LITTAMFPIEKEMWELAASTLGASKKISEDAHIVETPAQAKFRKEMVEKPLSAAMGEAEFRKAVRSGRSRSFRTFTTRVLAECCGIESLEDYAIDQDWQ